MWRPFSPQFHIPLIIFSSLSLPDLARTLFTFPDLARTLFTLPDLARAFPPSGGGDGCGGGGEGPAAPITIRRTDCDYHASPAAPALGPTCEVRATRGVGGRVQGGKERAKGEL